MQSCLENYGLKTRPVQIGRNDYRDYDPYSATHKDAIADGDAAGKGLNTGGHLFSVPDCNKAIMNDSGVFFSPIDYSNFDTHSEAGGCWDQNGYPGITKSGRKEQLGINIYGKEKEYGAELINTQANVNEGQFVVG